MAACPRGSYIRRVRRSSRSRMKSSRRSAIVAPGRTPMPPVMTRVGIPSVWVSTAWTTRRLRIEQPRGAESGLGVLSHLNGLVGGQRQSRWPARPPIAARDLHRQLDRLDELRPGVPAEDRMQVLIERKGLVE